MNNYQNFLLEVPEDNIGVKGVKEKREIKESI